MKTVFQGGDLYMLKNFLTPICIALAVGVTYTPLSVKAQTLPQSTTYTSQQSEAFVYNKLKLDIISYDKAPDALTKEIDLCKTNKGFLYYKDKNSSDLYVAVMAGEKSTTGYGIKVNSVEDVEGRANILVEETAPDKDSILPQLITYPYTIVKAQLPAFNISVKNSSGEAYNYLGSNGTASNIVGASWILGNLKNIYTTNDFIFLEIQDTTEESELYYAPNTNNWKNKIKNLKLNSTVSVQYALGTPQKYNEKSAFPLSEINLPLDKSSLTDKNWSDLKAYSNILPDKQWTISFKRVIKEDAVNSSNIYIVDSEGNKIPTAACLSEDKKSIKLFPYKPYKLGEKYYLFIMKDLYNTNYSLNGFRMNFQVTDSVSVE